MIKKFLKKVNCAINFFIFPFSRKPNRQRKISPIVPDMECFKFLEERITVTPTIELHKALSFKEPFQDLANVQLKPFKLWKMENDDAPIFRYIYRNFRPRRHLEFGTASGFGTRICLEECEATVWTINMLFGEYDSDGFPLYPLNTEDENDARTFSEWKQKIGLQNNEVINSRDTLCFIGMEYLSKSMGNRVCQIYTDSRSWDTKNYPTGFFDTVLIDGGHSAEILKNDTEKAFRLVREGGLIIWHDFCLDPDIFSSEHATNGVMTGIHQNWDMIEKNVSILFWIKPSFILVGIKN